MGKEAWESNTVAVAYFRKIVISLVVIFVITIAVEFVEHLMGLPNWVSLIVMGLIGFFWVNSIVDHLTIPEDKR